MQFSIEPSKYQLKVFSAICSNISAGWLAVIFVTKDILVLITDIIFAIIFWNLAVKVEEILEEYYA